MSTSPLVKLACSTNWQDAMNSWLKTACDLENQDDASAAAWAFRRALAIERLHKMVLRKSIPFYSLTKQAWVEPAKAAA